MLSGRMESKAAWMSRDVIIVCFVSDDFVISRLVTVLDIADSGDFSLQKPCWAS